MHSWLRASLVLGCWLVGCQNSSSTAPRIQGPPRGADGPVETYHPTSLRQASSALIYLAGNALQQLVSFEVVDGMAVLDGDILLGPATFVPFRFGVPQFSFGSDTKSAVARSSRSDLWPGSVIPYEIEPSVSPEKVAWIQWAVQHVNQTPLRMRPATGADQDRVFFRDSGESSGCYSYLGRIGGPQEIQVGGCGVRGSVVHEILHAAGFYHEQSRGDRDDFIQIFWDEIDPGHRSNFEIRGARGQDIGAYDYSSIMHYGSRAFSRTGRPTIVPRQAGAPIGQREGLSQLDRAAIQQLYGQGATLPPPGPAPGPAPGGGLPFPWPSLPFPWPVLTTPAPPGPAPAPAPAPAPTAGPAPLAGNYSSSRGPMACTESGTMVACSFTDAGVGGRLDCLKEQDGLRLSCFWMTFFPRPGAGRAFFTRPSLQSRELQGSWGNYQSDNDGGRWDASGRLAHPHSRIEGTAPAPPFPALPPVPASPALPAAPGGPSASPPQATNPGARQTAKPKIVMFFTE
jgi:astacin